MRFQSPPLYDKYKCQENIFIQCAILVQKIINYSLPRYITRLQQTVASRTYLKMKNFKTSHISLQHIFVIITNHNFQVKIDSDLLQVK